MNSLQETIPSVCRTLFAAAIQAVLVLGWSRRLGTIQLKITPVNKTLPPGLARWSGGTGSWDRPGCGSALGLAPCPGDLGWCHQVQACPSALSTPLPSPWGHSGPSSMPTAECHRWLLQGWIPR